MGIHPVTVGQFGRFVDATGYKTEAETGGGGHVFKPAGWFRSARLELDPTCTWKTPGFRQTKDHPVPVVSWNDARAFCEWASSATGHAVRLPSEAEWEYACRAGTKTKYHNGDTDSDLAAVGWYGGNSGSKTHPVGEKKANPWGLHDMHGNVYEWCADWYDEGFYKESKDSPSKDPECKISEQKIRILRGGSWYSDGSRCRAAGRYGFDPSGAGGNYGLRLCLSLD